MSYKIEAYADPHSFKVKYIMNFFFYYIMTDETLPLKDTFAFKDTCPAKVYS